MEDPQDPPSRADLLAEVDTLRRRLAHADRLAAIGQLAAGMAHEINNPAAFVLMNLGLMRENVAACLAGLDALPASSAVAAISLRSVLKDLDALLVESLEGMNRIKSVMGALKAISRPHDQELSPISLDDVARLSCELVAAQVRPRARLERSFGGTPTVLGDRGRLAQAVTNLVVNAAQAIPEGESVRHVVRVRTFVDDEHAVLAVEDTGRGIPPEVLPRIFEPFFTTKPEGEGTGLGLAVVDEIVRAHRGEVRVESSPGAGTRFQIRLPVLVDPQAASPAEPESRCAAAPRARVLLVDDDPTLLRAFARALAAAHDVVVAPGGARALEILADDARFDAVICDVVMPDVDGLAVYEAVRERHPELLPRFAFMTGGAVTERARGVVEETSCVLLEKPISLAVLSRTIASLARGDEG